MTDKHHKPVPIRYPQRPSRGSWIPPAAPPPPSEDDESASDGPVGEEPAAAPLTDLDHEALDFLLESPVPATLPVGDSETPVIARPLRFMDHGVAQAHIFLPLGSSGRETEAIENALLRGHEASAKIVFMTGQSDVMVELKVRDFRKAVELRYPSESTGVNWLFLVPYQLMPPATVAYKSDESLALTFVIHVRLARSIYRTGAIDAEQHVVRMLQHELSKNGIPGQVLAGLGWSDVVVSGTFSEMERLRGLIFAIENKTIEGQRIARRIETLVGYDKDLDVRQRSSMVVSPVLFTRTHPAHLRRAADALLEHLPRGREWTARTIDGKWDLLVTADQLRIPLHDFLKVHRDLSTERTSFRREGIERIETHLLINQVEHDDRVLPADHGDCKCRRIFDDEPPIVAESEASRLPYALRDAITRVLEMFRAASRDETNCCDIVPGLKRSTASARSLIVSYRHLQQQIDHAERTVNPKQGAIEGSHRLAQARIDLEEWCMYAERLVAQRTVGSFGEFLGQNDRGVSHRSDVQKLLYVADWLMNDYAARVFSPGEAKPFAILCDSVDTVVSASNLGMIRIPLRHLFLLPLAITHLWHEVGVQAFFNEHAPISDVIGQHSEAAQMYADCLTLHHAFDERLRDFTLALSNRMFEEAGFRSARDVGKKAYLIYLLTRLYLVTEFKMRRDLLASLQQRSLAWEPTPRVIQQTIEIIADQLTRELLSKPRYRDVPRITPQMIALAASNVGHEVDVAYRPYMNELVMRLAQVSKNELAIEQAFTDIMNGHVISLAGVDPNALYQRMQRQMIETILDTTPGEKTAETFLRPNAALMRSVLLHFYEKQ